MRIELILIFAFICLSIFVLSILIEFLKVQFAYSHKKDKKYDYKFSAEYIKENKLKLNTNENILFEIHSEFYDSNFLFWITNERIIVIDHDYSTSIDAVEIKYLNIKDIKKLVITTDIFNDTSHLLFVSSNLDYKDVSIFHIEKDNGQKITELLKNDIIIEEMNLFTELKEVCEELGTKNQYGDLYIEKQNTGKYIDILFKRAIDINNSNLSIIFDCKNIIDEESFWDEIQAKFTKNCDWFGRNFNAFIDALRGNCGLFENILPVNVSIINIKYLANKGILSSFLIDMIDVLISYVYEIQPSEYSIKYIEDLKNSLDTIYLKESKFISLRLYENEIY